MDLKKKKPSAAGHQDRALPSDLEPAALLELRQADSCVVKGQDEGTVGVGSAAQATGGRQVGVACGLSRPGNGEKWLPIHS